MNPELTGPALGETVLHAERLRCGYGRADVLRDINLTVRAGDVVCLLGPNGAGKTTLFKALLGLLPLRAGHVLLRGRELRSWSRRELGQITAYVPQAQTAPFPFTVSEVVLMGRTPRLGVLSSPGRVDVLIADEALERLGIGRLAQRPFTEISGGERQLVLIARALAQQPTLLLMDEPTSDLDLGNQTRVLRQIRAMASARLAVLMISHSPDHALAVATTVALLRPDGSLLVGPPADVITETTLAAAYGEPVRILSGTAADGTPISSCVPLL